MKPYILYGRVNRGHKDINWTIWTGVLLMFYTKYERSWHCTPCFVMFCVFLYGPFCHGAHKLDLSTLFTTFFLWTSPPFIFRQEYVWKLHSDHLTYVCNKFKNLGNIPVKLYWNPVTSGFRGKAICVKLLNDGGQRTTDHDGRRPITIAHFEKYVLWLAKTKHFRNIFFSICHQLFSK